MNNNDTNINLIYKQGMIKQDSRLLFWHNQLNRFGRISFATGQWRNSSSLFSTDISFDFLFSKQPKCLFTFSSDKEE